MISMLGLMAPQFASEIVPFVVLSLFLCCCIQYGFRKVKHIYERPEQPPRTSDSDLPILGNVIKFVAPSTRK